MPDMSDDEINAMLLTLLTQRQPDEPHTASADQPEFAPARAKTWSDMMTWENELNADSQAQREREADEAQNAELFQRTLDSVLGRSPRGLQR